MSITANDAKGYAAGSFQKQAIVAEDGTVTFKHEGANYHLTHPDFKELVGKEVSIDAGLTVFRAGKNIGRATKA